MILFFFSENPIHFSPFFRHPTMRCSHWLTYSLEGILSHFISFHFISHLFFYSHPALFFFAVFPSIPGVFRIVLCAACVCISTRVFLTITLLIVFYIFLLDFCCITSKIVNVLLRILKFAIKNHRQLCVHSAHNLRYFFLLSHSTWHWHWHWDTCCRYVKKTSSV